MDKAHGLVSGSVVRMLWQVYQSFAATMHTDTRGLPWPLAVHAMITLCPLRVLSVWHNKILNIVNIWTIITKAYDDSEQSHTDDKSIGTKTKDEINCARTELIYEKIHTLGTV